MPQLNPEFFVSQLFWLAVFFTFLFVFLWRVSLPRIATVLEKRQNKIDENLSSAKELQEQAMEIEKKINDQINQAKLETDEKIKNTINNLQEDASSQLFALDRELEKKVLDAEKEIKKNKDNQIKNINNEIANITKLTLGKITDIELSDSDLNKVIETNKVSLN
jgi:F-type H+-transporting ATPase subunit b|tara:strand:+ start:139 stop:630 length:492 start_codon:yes stop_codon:yes gene_type:complete